MDEETDCKSIVVKHFGGYDALEVKDVKLPSLDGNVEVEVQYCGLNFADLYTRQGLMNKKVPFVLGMECAGVITKLGFESTEYTIGAKVICYNCDGGLYRKTVRVPPKYCFVIPDNVDLKIGAAIFVNYLTAYFALYELGNLRKNQNVFISSCAGGVGWAATQLARRIPNTKIYGTASSGKEESVTKNGVDCVLPHDNLAEQLRTKTPSGFDIILDNQSGNVRAVLEGHLRTLGRIILLGANSFIVNDKKINGFKLLMGKLFHSGNVDPVSLIMKNSSVSGLHLGLLVENEREKVCAALAEILSMLERGEIEPQIDSVWDFEDVVEATKVLAERRNIGKVLLKL